ncbi:MAG: hypothetical protein AAFY71_27650 [Bacteroidota bacterium]
MRRVIFLFSLIASLSTPAFAQPFDALIPFEEGIAGISDFAMFSDKDGSLLFIREAESALVLVLNDQLEVEKRFRADNIPSEDSHEQLGYTYTNGELSIVFLNRSTYEYEVLSIFPESEESLKQAVDMSRLSGGNVFWGTFTYEGSLHVVRIPRGTNKIRLCKFEGQTEFATQEYDVEEEDFLNAVRDNLTRIDLDNPPSLESTYLPGKLYQYGNQLYLSLDDKGATHVVHINLKTGEKEEFTLDAPTLAASAKSNSLIIGDVICQASANRDSLKISMIHMDTEEEIGQYVYGRKDDIDVRFDGPYKSEGLDPVVEITSTDEYLFELNESSYIALGGEMLIDSVMELQIGGVEAEVITGVTGMVIEEKFSKTYFTTFFSTYTWNPLFSMPEPLVNRRFPPPAHLTKPLFKTFQINGVPYFGYYDEDKGAIYLSR